MSNKTAEQRRFSLIDDRRISAIPNESVKWRLQTADGKYFGDVSYNAYKAIENNTLDKYTPVNDSEKKIISKYRNYVENNSNHNSLIISDYKPLLGETKVVYEQKRLIDPSLPVFGSYQYFVNKEKELGAMVDEINDDISRRDIQSKQLREAYAKNPNFTDDKAVLDRAKRLYYNYQAQERIIDAYNDINNQLKKFEISGVHYDNKGNVDTKSGIKEAEYEKQRSDRLRIAKGNESSHLGVFVDAGLATEEQEEEYENYIIADATAENAVNKVKAYKYYEENKDNDYTTSIWGRIAGNYRLGRTGIKSNDAGFTSYKTKSNDIEASQVYNLLSKKIQENNRATFTNHNKFDKFIADVAQYAPQGIDQALVGLGGKTVGCVAGFLLSYGNAGVAKTGARIGSAAATAAYMYKQTAGAAYVRLLENSELSIEDARALATNEAIFSSIIEFGLEYATAGLWLGKSGAGKIVKKFGKKVVSEATENATKSTFKNIAKVVKNIPSNAEKKLVSGLVKAGITEKGAKIIVNSAKVAGKLAINSGSEGAEEWMQTGVSITADKLAKKGEKVSMFDLVTQSFDFSQYTDDDYDQMSDAFWSGATIGIGHSTLNAVAYNAPQIAINTIQKIVSHTTDVTLGKEILSDARSENIIKQAIAQGKVSTDENTVKIAEKLENDLERGKTLSANQVGKVTRSVLLEGKNIFREDIGYFSNKANEIQSSNEDERITTPQTNTSIKSLEDAMLYNVVSQKTRTNIVSSATELETTAKKEGKQLKNIISGINKLTNSVVSSAKEKTGISLDYWAVYEQNIKFLSSSGNVVDADFVHGYINTFVEMIKSNNSAAFKALSSDGVDIAQALYDYITTGVIPEGVTNTKAFMSVAETMKNILTESISANISAHNSIYGENATLDAQLEAIKNGDFSFLASTTEVGKTVLSKEEYERNCVTLVTMEDVASLVGNEMDGKLPLKEKVSNLFESLGGSVYVEGFGDIALTNSSIHSEWRHGRTRDKITSFVAIPNVLQNGVVIDIQSKNRGEVERVIFAAPICIGKGSYFMGAMVQRDSNSKRLYLHDVVIRKEVSEYLAEHLNTTGPENNENLYMTDVLNKAVAVGYNISQNEQIVNNNGMQNAGNNTSEIVTLKRQRSIYSAFKDTEKVIVGVDCITDGKVVVPKRDAALEAIMAVTDAQIEENGNYSLVRVYNKANSVVIEGEPKVIGDDVYVFKIDGNYYACRQKHLEAFSDNGLIIKANTNEKTAWTVHDENGNLVACFMPMKSYSFTEDTYNSLPYVSEVLAKDDSTDETSTKELKNQVENDTIEENNIDSIDYSLESDTEGIDAGDESQHKSYGGADFDYSKTTQKIYNNRAWAYTLLSKEDLRLLNEKYYEHFKTKAYRKAKLSDGKTRVIEINNKLLFVSGTYNNPIIEAVLVFNTDNATYMEVLKLILFPDVVDDDYSKYSLRRIKNDRQIFENYGKVDSFDYYGREDYSAITARNGWGAKIEDGRKAFGYTGSFTIRDGIYRKDESRVSGTLSNTSGIKYSFVEDNEYDFNGFRNEEALESEAENEQGNNILNGSEQRNVGKRSGKQTGRVGKSSRRAGEKSIRQRQGFLRGLNANQKEEQLLTDSEGRKHKFTVVKKSAWNEHMKNLAAFYEAQGVTVEFLDGNVQIAFVGTEKTARGMRVGDTIYVSYNNRRFSPEQIVEHEFIHNKYTTDEVQEARKQILERMPEEEYNKAIEKIGEAYSGIVNKNVLEEELICNILSGMYENSAEYADIASAYWSKAENDISGYDVSQYAESIDAGGVGKSIADDVNSDEFEQIIDNEVLHSVSITKVKMRQFPSRKESGGSDTNQNCTLWSYREDVFAGDQTIVFHNGRCYVIEKYDDIEFKYQIVGRIRYADYAAVREEILTDVRNNNESTIKEMVDIYNKRNRQGNWTEGRGQGSNSDSVEYRREDRQILQMDTNQDGGREIRGNSSGSDAHNSTDRQTGGRVVKRYSIVDGDRSKLKLSESGEINGSKQNSDSEELGRFENSGKTEGHNRVGKVGYSQSKKTNTPHTKRVHRSGVSAETITSSGLTAEQTALREQNRIDKMSTEFYVKATEQGVEQSDLFVTENTIYYPDSVFERNDIIINDGVASFTEIRFNDLIDEYSVHVGGQLNNDYAQAYVAYISPSDFLRLTTINEELIVYDTAQYGTLDVEILRNNDVRHDGPYLEIDFESGRVYEHNGRHRMVLLRNAGINKVAIVIKDVSNFKNKYKTTKHVGVVLLGQKFNNGESAPGKVTIDEIIPLSPNYREEVRDKFVSNQSDIKYSLADDGEYDLIDIWNEAVETYGAIPEGEKPAREVSVPKKISENEPVSYFARTMMEAGVTPDDALSEFEQTILDGTMSHEVITDKRALKYAQETIKREGFDQALEDWSRDSARGKVGKKDLAVGMELYNQCVNNKDYKNAMKIAAELAAEATRAGQTLQACRLLKQMSPDGQLYYLEKSVAKMNEEFKQKLGKKFEDIELDEALMEQFYLAESEEQRNTVYDRICQNIADQIPATLLDKWNSWRYLAMLGNPRTHIRNIVGNAIFTPAIRIKNYIGAIGEGIAKVDTQERTKSLTKSRSAIEFAKKDFNEMVKVLQGVNAKYAVTTDIEGKRQIFKTKALEKLRTKNFEFLEMEDMWFLKTHYVDALSRIITARKIDVNSIDSDTLDKVRAYAVKEAQSATYRDANALAEGLNKLQKKAERSGYKTVRATSVLIEGVMPFKKTPLNIAKQGVLYSPISILTGTYQMFKGVKEGTHTVTDAIDTLSKGLTGTGLMLLGYFLAQLGILSGDEEEPEKKQKFDKLAGEQIYSINIGDASYTIDWAAPLNLALFTGTALYDITNDGEISFAKLVDALSALPEPLLELSVFSGISDIISSAQYNKANPITPIVFNMGTNYITQALPTIGGQISRLIEPTKRNYYYYDRFKEMPRVEQNFVGKIASKIPFASKLFEPEIDLWGREETYGELTERIAENFVSPGYYSQKDYSAVNKELQELYNRTGETDVLPRTQQPYYTEAGVQYYMTAKQYTEAKKLRGQKAFELVRKLIGSSKYSRMSDKEKVKAIVKCYDEAGDYAKEQLIDKVKNN